MIRFFKTAGWIVLCLLFLLMVFSPNGKQVLLWIFLVCLVGWGMESIIRDATEATIRKTLSGTMEAIDRIESHLETIAERASVIAANLGCEEEHENDDEEPEVIVDDENGTGTE